MKCPRPQVDKAWLNSGMEATAIGRRKHSAVWGRGRQVGEVCGGSLGRVYSSVQKSLVEGDRSERQTKQGE